MGSSPKSDYTPPAEHPAPSGVMTPTPGGGAPNWNSILPTGGGPAQLTDPFRSEASGPAAPPATVSASTPPAGAAPAAASAAVPAAVANLPPAVQREYMAAKAAGNDELAARILLTATMMGGSPVARNTDRSGGERASSGPGPGWGGGVAGGMGGRSSGGVY